MNDSTTVALKEKTSVYLFLPVFVLLSTVDRPSITYTLLLRMLYLCRVAKVLNSNAC